MGLDALTPAELDCFHQLQTIFSRPTILEYYDPKRHLYIDLDASKARGFGTIVYHYKDEDSSNDSPRKSAIEPILFLSKLLNDAEQRYWPMELEVSGLVWTIRKILIESAE